MKLLSIDTSTKNFSLAVSADGKILAYKKKGVHKALSDSIVPTIDAVLKKARVPFKKIDGFAVGLGPGSFTSLRVGLSTIKAFAFATKKPVVGVGSLDIIAMNVFKFSTREICVLCDARRDLVYGCVYQVKRTGLKRKTPYLLVPIQELLKKTDAETVFVGDGLKIYRDYILSKEKFGSRFHFAQENKWYPDARELIQLSLARFKNKKYDEVHKLAPLYLYPEHCQVAFVKKV